jgi:hypothetical protein
MSNMAKIFVVVNLIFSVVVFGSAATLLGAQDDYKVALKQAAEDLDMIKAAKDAEITRLNKEVGNQTNKASQAVAAKTIAEGDAQDKTARLAEAKTVNDKLTATVEKFTQELQGLRETNAQYKDWLARFGEEAKSATQDKLNYQNQWQEEVGNRVRLEEEVGKLVGERDALAADKADLAKELKNTTFWLNKYRERYGDMTTGPAGAPGRVLSVRGNLVSLSVGSKDGVKIGDTYQIRRGAVYVGEMVVKKVYADQSVGEFDTEFTGKGAPPMPGDQAEPGSY